MFDQRAKIIRNIVCKVFNAQSTVYKIIYTLFILFFKSIDSAFNTYLTIVERVQVFF